MQFNVHSKPNHVLQKIYARDLETVKECPQIFCADALSSSIGPRYITDTEIIQTGARLIKKYVSNKPRQPENLSECRLLKYKSPIISYFNVKFMIGSDLENTSN